MPSPTRCLDPRDVRRFVDERVFTPGWDAKVGIELEWVTRAPDARSLTPSAIRNLLPDGLPGGSSVTFEPGGQLELSGPARQGISTVCRDMAADVEAVRRALTPAGITLVATGLDPLGPRPRVVDAPRYRAMERYFDTHWPEGRTMMCNTASIQVNLDIGRDEEIETRWRLAHDLGPVLAAAFANSPLDAYGNPTGWRSTRLAVWHAIDPGRTNSAFRAGTDARDFVDAVHDRRTGDADPRRREHERRPRPPLHVRRLVARRARARLAHARRLRLPPHDALPADPPARAGSSCA